ncbi:MAG: Vitamin B12 import ATP-binding protein BtuD [Fimbriimonadaceae bacterium]|nr:Vitamin B12 import ATP-binding protein BtuD [Fimbriimonadaceae bacterium]
MAVPVLRALGLSKAYGGVQALCDLSLDLNPGEVHAVCGENGAGKSTLNRILSGVVRPDAGSLEVAGRSLPPGDVVAAETAGVAIVHQESAIFANLNAADNIALMHEPTSRYGMTLDRRTMDETARAALDELGESFPVDQRLEELSLAQRQMVGIAKAISRQCRVLILDEPTASLSSREAASLFAVIRRLQAKGVAIVYVSHRLDEVFELADQISVLRDGRLVETRPATEWTPEGVIRAMVGREVEIGQHTSKGLGDVRFEAQGLTRHGAFRDVSFAVRSGEIVGLAGLIGAGRSELARAIMAIEPADAGTCLLDGSPLPQNDPASVMRRGVAYVPEDRQHEGLHLPLPIALNAAMAGSTLRPALATVGGETDNAIEVVRRWGVKAASVSDRADSLSGGNQQKLLLGKWLATSPRFLILDEPTRGVDVAAKADIHREIRNLADTGIGILLISSELNEVLSLADRVIVMRQGSLAGEVPAAAESKEAAMELALPKEDVAALATGGRKPYRTELFVGGLLAVILAIAAIVNAAFASLDNLRDLATRLGPVWIVATAMALVIMTREIDISVGAAMGFCAAMLGVAVSPDRWGLSPPAAITLCLAVGMAIGLVNGLLVAVAKVPSIIVTLGTATLLQGLTELAMGGKWITDLPAALRSFGAGATLGIPNVVLMAVATSIAGWWALNRMPIGRRLLALGGNPDAARLAGIPSNRLKIGVFAAAGLAAGVAALFGATQLQVIESGFGRGFELTVIAAVVVGGTSIRGGRGSIGGVWLGAALLGALSTVLIFLKLGDTAVYWERAIQGAVILAAVAMDFRQRRAGAA